MKISYRSPDEVVTDIDNTVDRLYTAWRAYMGDGEEFQFEHFSIALDRLALYRAEYNIILLYGERNNEDAQDEDD